MQFDQAYFDAGINRRGTHCEKWDDRGVMGEDGIPLWVADMDFPCAPGIEKAVKMRAEHACFGYNNDEANREVTDALIAFWQRRHDLTFGFDQVVTLPCVITGLKTCVRAFTREGDGVAMFTPVYGPFYASVELNRRRVMPVSLQQDENGRYPMNLAGMEKALGKGMCHELSIRPEGGMLESVTE